jgi:HK97 family phage major capsid protein
VTRDELVKRAAKVAAEAERTGWTPELRGEFDSLERQVRGATSPTDPADTRGIKTGSDTEYRKAFDDYIRHGIVSPSLVEHRVSAGLTTAPNAGQTDTANAGYEIPQDFWVNLQIALKAYGGLSSHYHQVESETGAPMPWPTLDPTGVTASVLGQELTQLATANPYAFGQGMMQSWTLAVNPVLVSLQLLADNAFNVNDYLSRLLGEAIGRELAALSVSGTGSSQPLGIITALNAKGALSGASGGYYPLTAATTVTTFASTAPTELAGNILSPISLIGMIQGVDPAYYPTCAWYFNSNQAWNLRTVTDSNKRPILNFANGFDADDMATGEPASSSDVNSPVAKLFGFPVYIDNSIPNLAASTTGGPVFGSMQHAMVMRTVRNGVNVMRLDQRWADYLAVGFLGWGRYEIRSNDLRAAVTVKPAAT